MTRTKQTRLTNLPKGYVSQYTMAEKVAAKGWTDTEKMGLVFQILNHFGTIPWDQITLPEGRTKKACSVMIDKEKAKVKKAREAEGGGEGGSETTSPKKRKAEGEATPKKAKSPRKKNVKAGADEVAAEDSIEEDAAPVIKDEEDEEMA
ncbi:hypothetical protein LTR09_007462 [Extremus antarcticus]|uniref:Uncharacterized protein n=1 Tax=Extremus antarcticus TaxID=702011 RepID=A0AAJ0DJJ5_9PEZI|nr:hypothetical protein LTR09_007462 [Extremus antarcticus]